MDHGGSWIGLLVLILQFESSKQETPGPCWRKKLGRKMLRWFSGLSIDCWLFCLVRAVRCDFAVFAWFFSFLVCQEAVPKSPIWVDAPDFTSDVLDQKPLEHSVFSHHGLFLCHLNPLRCSEETKKPYQIKTSKVVHFGHDKYAIKKLVLSQVLEVCTGQRARQPTGPQISSTLGHQASSQLVHAANVENMFQRSALFFSKSMSLT